MNNDVLVNKIKDSLKSLLKFSSELKDEEFASFDLTDGTKITSTSKTLEVGSEVYAIDDQGNQTPLNDGDYVLTDGRTITVALNKITVITGGDTETPAEEAAPTEEVDQAMTDGLPDSHPADATGAPTNDIEARLTDLEKQVQDILNIINKIGDAQGGINEQMMSKIKDLSDEPGEKAIKTTKKGYSDYKKGSSDFYQEIKELINSKTKK